MYFKHLHKKNVEHLKYLVEQSIMLLCHDAEKVCKK